MLYTIAEGFVANSFRYNTGRVNTHTLGNRHIEVKYLDVQPFPGLIVSVNFDFRRRSSDKKADGRQ